MQEAWSPCKVYIKFQKQKPRQAYVVLHTALNYLKPKSYVVLLIMHPNGTVFQVLGRVARRRGNSSLEIYIPVDAALTLAAWMNVKVEGNTTIHGYVAKIDRVQPPT
jgi:hypothetical protein